jgi:arsenate reductase (thioredoxin)
MKLLFLCVANSARSQIAEGLAKKIFGDEPTVQSAGSCAAYVHPAAIKVMAEIGIDITDQYSKSVNTIDPETVDTVITLCAEEYCPTFLDKAKKLHWPIQNPVGGSDEESQLRVFRQIRDEIRRRLEEFKRSV